MYITKKDLETLAAAALKDRENAGAVLEVLDRLNVKREKDNARTWDYIKKKREEVSNYGRPKNQIKKLDISSLNF